MAEQHDKILETLGLSPDQVAALNKLTPEQVKELKLDEYIAPINTSYETKLLNDGNFLGKLTAEKLPETLRKTIEGNQYGRFMNELREVATKELGLDLAEIPEETQKSLKSFFRKANEVFVAKKAPDAKTLTALQQQLQDAIRGKETAEGSLQTKIDEALQGEKTKTSATLEKLATMLQISNLTGYKLKVPPEYVIDNVLNKLKNKYALQFDQNNLQFAVMQKEHPTLAALKGSENLKYSEALIDQLVADGLVEKVETKESEVDTKTRTITVGADGKTEIPAYIAGKMTTALKEEKEAVKT